MNTRWSGSEGPGCTSPGLNHHIWDGQVDPGYPARSTAEGVGGLLCFELHMAGVMFIFLLSD